MSQSTPSHLPLNFEQTAQRRPRRSSEPREPTTTISTGAEEYENVLGSNETTGPVSAETPQGMNTTSQPAMFSPGSLPNTPAPPSRNGSRRLQQSREHIHQQWHNHPGYDYAYRPQYPSYRPPPRTYSRPSHDTFVNDDWAWDDEWAGYNHEYQNSRPPPPVPNRRRPATSSARGPPPSSFQRSADKAPQHHRRDSYDEGYWDAYLRSDMRADSGAVPGSRENFQEQLRNTPPKEVLRLPWTMWMNSDAKNHFVAACGELVGTFMFLFFAFAGTQVANIGSQGSNTNSTTTNDATGFSPTILLYISFVFSFSLLVNAWIFFRVSGGLFNPAVTLAMLLTRSITLVRAALLLVSQLAGSIFASYIVKVLFPTQFNVRTTLSANTSLARGVFIEAILTAELVFTIFMLAKEKHRATFIAPIGIGWALFIGELVGVYYTGGSLNPARSFGPCVVTGSFDREHWIYWVGPGIGAVLAVVFYQFIKALEYEVANPGQDSAGGHGEDAGDVEASAATVQHLHQQPHNTPVKEASPVPSRT